MRRLSLAPDAIARARQLRRDMTPEERSLWRALRESYPHAHWRKQVPFGTRYKVDFCSHAAKLIVEVDGGQHDERQAYDEARTAFLNAEGYRVLRIWNNDVRESLEGVLTVVGKALASPLVGEVGGGRRASAREQTLESSGEPDGSPPPPNPPHKGEGLASQISAPLSSSSNVTATSALALSRTRSPSTAATSPPGMKW